VSRILGKLSKDRADEARQFVVLFSCLTPQLKSLCLLAKRNFSLTGVIMILEYTLASTSPTVDKAGNTRN